MSSPVNFDTLLPRKSDPHKAAIRAKLVEVLNSRGEILPSADNPRGKLWRLVNSPESSIDECKDVILLDTALSSRIFRVANSGVYGRKTGDLGNALRRLGLKFVREQVFNEGIFEKYSEWVLPKEWDLFWLRGIFVARLCERMSPRFGDVSGFEYLAGLIHDIGWLFLATYVPGEFTELFACGKPISQAEKQMLPVDHAGISAAIAIRSELPASVVDAIRYHHETSVMDLSAFEAKRSYHFLAVILSVCDKIADAHGMDMFSPSSHTMEELLKGIEVQTLNRGGQIDDLAVMAEEELNHSRMIFEVFFSGE